MQSPFDPAAARANALRFSKQQFIASIRTALDEAIAEKSGERGLELEAAARLKQPVEPTSLPRKQHRSSRRTGCPGSRRADHASGRRSSNVQ